MSAFTKKNLVIIPYLNTSTNTIKCLSALKIMCCSLPCDLIALLRLQLNEFGKSL